MPGVLFSEWLSGNRRCGPRGTLTFALITHKLLYIAPYGYLALRSVREMASDQTVFWMRRIVLKTILAAIVIPLYALFEIFVLFVHILTILDSVISDLVGCVFTLLTLGWPIATEQRWGYEVFMTALEACVGPLWQESRVIVISEKVVCTCANGSEGCCEGSCFEVKRFWSTVVCQIKCECYRSHVTRFFRIIGVNQDCYPVHDSGDELIEKSYPGQTSLLKHSSLRSCGIMEVDLHRRLYDPARLMWISTTYRQSADWTPGKVAYETSRVGLTEVLEAHGIIDESNVAELSGWGARVFARQYAVGRITKLRFESVMYCRMLFYLATIIVAVVAISREEEAGPIAATVVLLVFIVQVVNSVNTEWDLDQIFDNPLRVGRVLDIEVVSSARYLRGYSPEDTCWTMHPPTGSRYIGKLTWLENLIGNRSIIVNNGIICLSRIGTAVRHGTVQVHHASQVHINNWRVVSQPGSFTSFTDPRFDINQMRVGADI